MTRRKQMEKDLTPCYTSGYDTQTTAQISDTSCTTQPHYPDQQSGTGTVTMRSTVHPGAQQVSVQDVVDLTDMSTSQHAHFSGVEAVSSPPEVTREQSNISFPAYSFESVRSSTVPNSPDHTDLCNILGSIQMAPQGDHGNGSVGASSVSHINGVRNRHRSWSSDTMTGELFQRNNEGDTELHTAIIMQDVEMALLLIDMAPDSRCLDIQNDLFQSPLHLAVITKLLDVVRRLVVAGVDLEPRDRKGNTPLHISCREGDNLTTALLLQTLVSGRQNSNQSSGNQKFQNLEIRNACGLSCLHMAAMNQHLDTMKLLIEKGADVNAKELSSGRTILHEAARTGNMELVQFLMSYPACNINAHAYDDCTPFDLARYHRKWNVATKLAEAGAKDESDSE